MQQSQMNSHHYFLTDLQLNQSTPLMFLLINFLVLALSTLVLKEEQLQFLGFQMYRDSIEIDEELPSFFQALPESYLERLKIQQLYIEQSYRFNVMTRNFLDELDEAMLWAESSDDRKIVNIPWYNIQYVPHYMQAFAWIGPWVYGRDIILQEKCHWDEDMLIHRYQCDFVTIFLNLSAIPRECIQNLQISNQALQSTNLCLLMEKHHKMNDG